MSHFPLFCLLLSIGDSLCLPSDTAGLRDATVDEIEREGMRRALTTVDYAHLAIFVADGSDPGASVNLLRCLRQNAAVAEAAESPGGGGRVGSGRVSKSVSYR